ncbi:MAG: hypothetical protein A2097_08710 [Desulfobacula sp. GWF2_41_7]|nr:MAG: hypothetical protein A2097_08710 [Desulfobacula sp. GWF2_41_7]
MAMRKFFSKKIIVILGIIILLYSLAGFFLIPVLGKNIIRDKLTKTLGRDVLIEKMSVNPFSLTTGIDGLKIIDKNKEDFVSVNKIFINLSASSLFILAPVVSQVLIENPYIKLVQHPDGSFNFSDMMNREKTKDQPNGSPAGTKDDSKKEIFGFVLKNVSIMNGEVDFQDKKKEVAHQIKDFSFIVPFLSSRRQDIAKPADIDIRFVFNTAKCNLTLESALFADDLATKATLKVSDVNMMHYLAYIPVPENLKLASLDAGFDLHADMTRKNSKISLLIDGRIDTANAAIMGAADEKILSFPSLFAEISPSDILSGRLNISKILLSSPELNIERNESGDLSLSAYIPAQNNSPETDGKKVIPFALEVENCEIKDGLIAIKDLSNKSPFDTVISPLNLTVTRLKVKDAISGEFQVSLKTLFEETLESKGEFQTKPVKAKGSLSMGNFHFNRYAPYYENRAGLDVRDGVLDFSLEFETSKEENKTTITSHELLIQSLSVWDRKIKEEMINIPEIKLSGSFVDLTNRKIDIGGLFTRNGKVLIKRDKKGLINLAESLLPENKTRKKALEPVEKKDNPKKLTDAPATPPWALTLNSFDSRGFNFLFSDLTCAEPVNIELSDISMNAGSFRNFGDEKGKFNTRMKWGKDGNIEISGEVNPLNLDAGLIINLEKIDIKSLQPYFTDTVKILVTEGNLNAKGKLLVDMKQKTGKHIGFSGETSVTGFSSLDKKSKEDFFNCNSFYLTGLDISLFPVEISAKEIALTDFYSKIMVSDSGEFNLSTIFKSDLPKDKAIDEDPEPVKPFMEKPKINIEKITLQGGNIDFSDYLTKPNFKAGMKEIAGSLTGLSSDEQSRAKLHLKGVHSLSSPLEILGIVNLLAEKKFAEINVSFKNIDLSGFTPYSSKYLGYKIEKGKLILDLKYTIDDTVLKSENRARFDNFELGEKVDSEHATSLPVSLAISLLKNRQGQIDLNLPVEGKLDDPQVKLGPVILKMIGNMILKVITSPFSIIGSMFGGGGEELSYAEFEFGGSEVRESDYEKIDKLAVILQEKPSVRLEIQGVYNPIRDAEGIREKNFNDLLKKERSKKAWYSLPFSKTPENAPLTAEEREKYTQKVYDDAQFPKPRDEKGSLKKIGLEEKKKLLITHINIDETDLRSLAATRAENIKAYVLSTGKVEKERIFMVEPIAVEKEKADQTGRVNFILK